MIRASGFSFDPVKREATIAARGLDLLDMSQLFDGRPHFTYPSNQKGEERFVTVAELRGKLYATVWTYRENEVVHLITARRAWIKEERVFAAQGLAREVEAGVPDWLGAKKTQLPVETAQRVPGVPEIDDDDLSI